MGDGFKSLLKTVEKAFKKLHKNGKYKPEDLGSVPEYRAVIKETNGILSRALEDNHISDGTLKRLEEDVFLFSGLKTHAQLLEASRQLLTKEKKIKRFEQFSKDVSSIKNNYNDNYLESEYDFAVGSVLMADKWDNLGDSDRYHLQYRTAGDDRVRDSHDAMRDITLPKNDSFWDSYFPPNGWRCRCTTVEVLARNNEKSDSGKAAKAGRAATTKYNKSGKNKLEIFRFNPGQAKVVFPPEHPYRKVQDAGRAGPMVLEILSDDNKAARKSKDKEIKEWAKENVNEKGSVVKANNFKTGKAFVRRKNVRNIAGHFTDLSMKEMAKDVFEIVKGAKYADSAKLDQSRKGKTDENIKDKKDRGVEKYNYYRFQWNGEEYRLNVEVIDGKEYPFSVNKIINAD